MSEVSLILLYLLLNVSIGISKVMEGKGSGMRKIQTLYS